MFKKRAKVKKDVRQVKKAVRKKIKGIDSNLYNLTIGASDVGYDFNRKQLGRYLVSKGNLNTKDGLFLNAFSYFSGVYHSFVEKVEDHAMASKRWQSLPKSERDDEVSEAYRHTADRAEEREYWTDMDEIHTREWDLSHGSTKPVYDVSLLKKLKASVKYWEKQVQLHGKPNEKRLLRQAKEMEEDLEAKIKGSSSKNPLKAAVILIGILGGIFFLSPNITGNVIGNLNSPTSNAIGGILMIIGIIAAFFYLKY